MRKIHLRRLGHVAMYVKDMDRALDFYVKGVGFHLTDRRQDEEGRDTAYLRCGTMHHDLCLIEHPDRAPGMDHVAYEVGSWWEMKRFEELCRAEGIEILWGPDEREHEGYCKSMMIQCPEMRLELFASMDEFDPPATVGEAGVKLRQLGHLGEVVNDTGALERFLLKYTNMTVRARISPVEATFVGVCEEDHDLALIKRGTLPGYSVVHVSYKLGSVPELHTVAEWLKQKGIKVLYGPGRRPAGNCYLLICNDPEGNLMEWYVGMCKLPADVPVRELGNITRFEE